MLKTPRRSSPLHHQHGTSLGAHVPAADQTGVPERFRAELVCGRCTQLSLDECSSRDAVPRRHATGRRFVPQWSRANALEGLRSEAWNRVGSQGRRPHDPTGCVRDVLRHAQSVLEQQRLLRIPMGVGYHSHGRAVYQSVCHISGRQSVPRSQFRKTCNSWTTARSMSTT